MYEETVERIARMMAEDNGDPQHWGVYATRAMQIIELTIDWHGENSWELMDDW
jgi:hypothetical protein